MTVSVKRHLDVGSWSPVMGLQSCSLQPPARLLIHVCVGPPQVVGRPFKFSRIIRVVRYIDGLQTLSATIMAALPATLQVRQHL